MEKLNLKIDKDKCTKCGLCVTNCDCGVLAKDETGYPMTKAEEYCLSCQHCLASCPTGAFNAFGKSSESSILNKDFVNPDDMLGLIKTRRSCRHYKHENVSAENIQKLKDMLAWVPTGCNNHGLHFSIIEDIDIMDRYRQLTLDKLKKVLRFIPIKGKLKPYKTALLEGKDVIYQGAPHLIAVSVPKNAPCKEQDPIIALSYFELYANSLGLGSLWCGFATMSAKMFPSLYKKLNIPKTHKLSYIMLFGNPDIKFIKGTLPKPCPFSVVK